MQIPNTPKVTFPSPKKRANESSASLYTELGIQAALAGGFKVLAFGNHTIQNRDVTAFHHMSDLPGIIDRIF